MNKLLIVSFIIFCPMLAQAESLKKVGIGKEYGEPIYAGTATLSGTYTRNYEDYTVMGIESPVCFEPDLEDKRNNVILPLSTRFCFSNSQHAHKLLNLPIKAKQGCFYEGKATIKIKNFSNYSSLDETGFDITKLEAVSHVSPPKMTCDE